MKVYVLEQYRSQNDVITFVMGVLTNKEEADLWVEKDSENRFRTEMELDADPIN